MRRKLNIFFAFMEAATLIYAAVLMMQEKYEICACIIGYAIYFTVSQKEKP